MGLHPVCIRCTRMLLLFVFVFLSHALYHSHTSSWLFPNQSFLNYLNDICFMSLFCILSAHHLFHMYVYGILMMDAIPWKIDALIVSSVFYMTCFFIHSLVKNNVLIAKSTLATHYFPKYVFNVCQCISGCTHVHRLEMSIGK